MTFENYQEYTEDVDWKLTLDVSNIWNQYSNENISIVDFSKAYKKNILEQQNNIISKISQEAWNKLQPVVMKLETIQDEQSANSIFDDIYDWADANLVYIKTNTDNETF